MVWQTPAGWNDSPGNANPNLIRLHSVYLLRIVHSADPYRRECLGLGIFVTNLREEQSHRKGLLRYSPLHVPDTQVYGMQG